MTHDWPMAPLGRILAKSNEWIDLKADETYKEVTVRLWGKGVTLRREVTGTGIAADSRIVVRANQFILSRIDARNGAFGLIPDELDGAVVSTDFPAFTVNESSILPVYLNWMSKTATFVDLCKAASEGTTNRVRLKEDRFLATEIPLPPLDEQRRLVARIEALAAKIEEARGLRRLAVEEAEALIASEISSVFANGKRNGWKEGVLGEYVIDDCYGTSEKTTDDDTGTPILRMGNIQNGRLDFRDLKYLHLGKKERNKLLLTQGDILVNRTNSAELVGKCAVFDRDDEFSFASYLIRLRLDMTQTDPRLVAMFINSPVGRAYMFNKRKQMTGQANVNATKLKALPIALPSSLEEQRRIVAYLDGLQGKVDALKSLQAQTQVELDALLPSVLDRAFKGEL
jgi:type I restriction enzyme, S subunit